jgi:hypothetical protein
MSFYKLWMKLNEYDDSAVSDPKRVARAWYNAVPKRTNYINTRFAKQVANFLTRYEPNVKATTLLMLGGENEGKILPVMPFDSKIYGTALDPAAKSLETPGRSLTYFRAGIALWRSRHPVFGFQPDDGSIVMFVPPIMDYGDSDIMIYYSACLHESRHAYDYLLGKLDAKARESETLSVDEYLTEPHEMRAMSEEIIQMIDFCCIENKMSWDEMKDAIIGATAGEAHVSDPRRVPVIAAYLDLLKTRHHAMGKWNTADEATVAEPRQTLTAQQYAAKIRGRIEGMINRIEQNGRRFLRDLAARNNRNDTSRN